MAPNNKPVSQMLAIRLKIKKNIICMPNGCPIILNNSYPITESDSDNLIQPISIPICDEKPPSWDFSIYENRLRTYSEKWILQFLTPSQMAEAGFYYLGNQDRVRCSFCSLECDFWQQGEDPVDEHKRQSPQCAFFKDFSAGYDVCGPYGSDPADIRSNNKLKKIQDFLKSAGILQQIEPPKFKDYATLEARVKSFEKCLIPLTQDIQILCEAGMFFFGKFSNDHMFCYYCGQQFVNWEENDEPWTEHAKWSEACGYVLLHKGKDFVDKACGVEIIRFNSTDLFQLIAVDKNLFISENDMKMNSSKRELDQSEIPNIGQIKITSVEKLQLCQKQNPNTMPDSMLCKICYKEEMEVAFIPCGHAISCIQCALTLEQCAVCRLPFNMLMRVHFSMDEKKVEDFEQLPCSSSEGLDEQLDPMLCKVCHKEEMAAAFIPCRHVYACLKCTADMHECPICTKGFCATIQVYL